MTTYAGSDWIKEVFKVEMSPLGEAVADLLGDLYQGIYHIHNTPLKKTDWSNKYWIEINLKDEMATWDFNHLTILVVFSHDRMIRVSIEGIGPGYLKLIFHQRHSREGSISKRMPTLEENVEMIRNHYRKE